jgi:hypothetical protein
VLTSADAGSVLKFGGVVIWLRRLSLHSQKCFRFCPLFFVRRLFAAWAVASALVPMAQMKPNSSRPPVTISIVRKFISKVLVQSVSL